VSGPSETSIIGRIKIALQGRQRGGDQESAEPEDILLNADRELSLWSKLVGHDGTSERIVKVEETRELGVALHGKDLDGNVDALRTNASKQLQVEVVGLTTGMLLMMVLRELRLANIHLGQISGLTEATTDDVEGHE
jgi:hypothetical protein